MYRISILIPTYNAGSIWNKVLVSINEQDIEIHKKIILDSGSQDDTVPIALDYKFQVKKIEKGKFDHGYARQLLADYAADSDILVYLTQDCILADKNSIRLLLLAFNDKEVAVAYGRQLPREGAELLEVHSRLFNYPAVSRVKTLADKKELGIKTASSSNSFAAYRKVAFTSVGGFPTKSIFGEDVVVAGKLLRQNLKVAYVADAKAYHSHNYTPIEEFRRFFDIGVFHQTNCWLLKEFGTANGEGFKYVKSELSEVFSKNILLLPKMILSTIGKYLGYKLGLNYQNLPDFLKKGFSMHKSYWK